MWMKCVGGEQDGEWIDVSDDRHSVRFMRKCCLAAIRLPMANDCDHDIVQTITYSVRRLMHPSWKITLPYLVSSWSAVPDESWLRAGEHWPIEMRERLSGVG